MISRQTDPADKIAFFRLARLDNGAGFPSRKNELALIQTQFPLYFVRTVAFITAMGHDHPYLSEKLYLLLRAKSAGVGFEGGKIEIYLLVSPIVTAPGKHTRQVLVPVGQGGTKMSGYRNP